MDTGIKLAFRNQSTYFVHLYNELDGTIDKRQSTKSDAPNFVHACDAAHLMLVVNAACAAGSTSVATVHDSFSCLVSQADEFRKIIREQFVQMYEDHNVLADLLNEAKRDLPAPRKGWSNLPRGELDLKVMRASDYAFA